VSLQSEIDEPVAIDTGAEPGRMLYSDPGLPPENRRPAWVLPVLVVATTVIVGLALIFILRDVAAADAVGGCGGV
jgi:hypothetical protein